MKSYLYSVAIISSFIALLATPLAAYLYFSGETLSIAEIAKKQMHSNEIVLYGSAIHNNTRKYKRYMLEISSPEIIALGSSRVMEFRGHMFASDFYNLGGIMSAVSTGDSLIPDILKKKPKTLILGADIWWFRRGRQLPNKYKQVGAKINPNISYPITVFDVKEVISWFFIGKLHVADIYNVIFGDDPHHIGVSGAKGDGFGPDGSHYSSRIITGKTEHHDNQFKETIAQIKRGSDHFMYGSIADEQDIEIFISMIDKLAKGNINVVVFFPPFAPVVYELLSKMKEEFEYIDDLKAKLTERGITFFDFSNPLNINSGSCEFVDGYHGGELTYMKVLLEMSKVNAEIKRHINVEHLASTIKEYNGLASVPNNEVTTASEVDFLDIGCDKLVKSGGVLLPQ
jgi:hypothetical protein